MGKPKNATGIIPTPNQLLACNINTVPGVVTNLNPLAAAKKKSNASMLQQALRGGGMLGGDDQVITSMNTKLLVSNFPESHTKEVISQICDVFGKVKSIDLLKDPATGELRRGRCTSSMRRRSRRRRGTRALKLDSRSETHGWKRQSCLWKRLTTVSAPSTSLEGEVFKSLIEDKPTCCLVMKNVVKLEEIERGTTTRNWSRMSKRK